MAKMVSKPSHVSHKISKTERKQVDSLLKVIPPKVYITDSSSFKRLVQELTGNGSEATSSPSPPPMQELIDQVPVIDIKDYGEPEDYSLGESYGGFEPSLDSGVHELSPLAAYTALQTSWAAQTMNEFECMEPEAWPTVIDPFLLYDSYTLEQEMMMSSQYDFSDLYDIL